MLARRLCGGAPMIFWGLIKEDQGLCLNSLDLSTAPGPMIFWGLIKEDQGLCLSQVNLSLLSGCECHLAVQKYLITWYRSKVFTW
jgi:hypothetical protein